jgi:hypothetical protein
MVGNWKEREKDRALSSCESTKEGSFSRGVWALNYFWP